MKKFWILALSFYYIAITKVYAISAVCNGLPWCESQSALGTKTGITGHGFFTFLWNTIGQGIKYIAVISVFSLMGAWVVYITSVGDDGKVEQAKKWITYALIGVLVSVSSWALINLLNAFKIA